jgi:hypothetical protein
MRRTIRQIAAQTMLLDGSQQETFVVDFKTSVLNLAMKKISPGQLYVLVMKQDANGNHTLTWGSAFRNAMMLDPAPNSVTVQCFIGMTGGSLLAVPPGTWTEEAP